MKGKGKWKWKWTWETKQKVILLCFKIFIVAVIVGIPLTFLTGALIGYYNSGEYEYAFDPGKRFRNHKHDSFTYHSSYGDSSGGSTTDSDDSSSDSTTQHSYSHSTNSTTTQRDPDDYDVEDFYLDNSNEFDDYDEAYEYLEDNEEELDDY